MKADHYNPKTDSCPAPMTRAALLALRNAGDLQTGCHYIVTNYNRGNVGAATILLHATDASTLSMAVHVQTVHDGVAWEGRYDIDTARLVELRDNLGNVVVGRYGTEVDRFPWGSTRVTETVVEHANLYLDAAPAITVRKVRVLNGALLDLRGASGSFQNSTVDTGALIYLRGASIAVAALEASARARIYGNNSTNVRLTYHRHEAEAYWVFTGRDDVRAIYTHFGATARVYFTAGTRQWLYYTTILGGYLRQFSGLVRLYYSILKSYSELRNEVGAGDFLGYGFEGSSRSYTRNYNTALVRSYYDTLTASGRQTYRGAATITSSYNDISSLATVEIVSPASIMSRGDIASQSNFKATGGTHYRPHLAGFSRLTAPFNTRSVIGHGSWAQTLTAANTNKMRDYVNNTLV